MKNLTVRELISKLETFDPNLKVEAWDTEASMEAEIIDIDIAQETLETLLIFIK